MTRRILSAVLALLLIFSSMSVIAFAEDTTEDFDVTVSTVADLRTALKHQRGIADDDEDIYRICVTAGTYEISTPLRFYSNTYLYSEEGTVYTPPEGAANTMMVIGDGETDTVSGYGYRNITVDGGSWVHNNLEDSTMFKIGHARNVSLLNLSMGDNYNTHLVEVAAVDGLYVDNCYFHDCVIDPTNTGDECIQLDILHKDHFNSYAHLEDEIDYLCKNVKVTNCRFINIPKPLGIHTAVINKFYDNIEFSGNYVESNADKDTPVLMFCNVTNFTVKNNTIIGNGNGIQIQNMSRTADCYYASKTDTFTSAVVPEANILIQGNKITSKQGQGILILGVKFKEDKQGSGDLVPAGDYMVSGVTIYKNKINAAASKKSGIYIEHSKNVSIKSNTLTNTAFDYYGIYVKNGSKNITIDSNKITTPTYAAIRTFNDAGAGFSANTIASISKNTIVGGTQAGISIANATVTKISGNNISSCPGFGILLLETGKASEISSNTITGCKNYAVKGVGGSKAVIYPNTFSKNSYNKYLFTCSPKVVAVDTKTISKVSGTSVKYKKSGKTAYYVKLSWKKSSNATGYIIYRSTSKSGTYTRIKTISDVSTLTYKDKDVKVKKGYYYKVQPYSLYNNSSYKFFGATTLSAKVVVK